MAAMKAGYILLSAGRARVAKLPAPHENIATINRRPDRARAVGTLDSTIVDVTLRGLFCVGSNSSIDI
jgi:hypothetical protein